MKPEEVFRFVNARPVHRAPAGRIERRFAAYSATEKSPFHRTIERVQGSEARQKAAELARKRLAQNDLDLKALEVVLHAVRGVEDQPSAEKARAKLKNLLDSDLNEYLKSREFRQLKDSLWDRLYAHTLVPEEKPDERGTIYEGLRALHFLELVAKQPAQEKPLTRAEIAAVHLLIPPSLLPGLPSRQQPKDEREKKETLAKLDTLHNQVTALNKAAAELRNNDRLYKAQQVNVASRVVTLPPTLVERPLADDTPAGASRAANAAPRKVILEQREELVPRKSPWVFEEFGKKNLSAATQKLLSARKSNLLEMELGELVGELEVEKYNLVSNFLNTLPQGAVQHVRSSPKFEMMLKEAAVPGLYILPYLPAAEAIDPTTATARGIQPLGIGDLLVVRQELLRYTAGEVAHIENVLKSEFKTRMHSRIRETEEIIITETERIEESEKDLQTTERFELHKEAQSTIENKMSLDAGVSVTASYGPVSVTAHADFALDQSSSESSKTASDFAKEITEKSVSRIMQRSREERTRRTLERFEERNEHGFDNKLGSGHVIGIYRWVDKYYIARLINYGKRLLIEFIVPEPAAFYLHLQSNQPLEGVTLEKPEEPMVYGRKLQPDDLNKSNISYYVAKYNVQDVEPYPAETVRVSAAFAESTGTTENASYAKTAEKLQVPAGYKCVDVFGQRGYQGISGSGFFIETFIAGEPWGSVVASGLEGIIPISVKGWMQAFHVNVVAICELKPETRKAWQLKTYAAIMDAYQRALADYNEQVSAAQIQAGVDIQGRNPEFNRKIEKDELKKGALRLLTNNFARTRVAGTWRFNEMFNAMQSNGQFGYPEFNNAEALVEGRILQFFEQAFEWNNLTYRFYPYFWGRKARWNLTFPLTDADPQFIDFLRAGAARVIVPVHPAYNETVLHYMNTNEIWNGGTPPTLDDPLFISIVDELKSDTGADIDGELAECTPEGEHPCLVEEWEIKLPTTLVYLQEDAVLPDFTTP